jgi:hypothetical protein
VLHAEKSQPYSQAHLLVRAHVAKELALLPMLFENYSNTFYIAFRENKYKLIVLVS